MATLPQYLASTQKTLVQFAKDVGISASYMSEVAAFKKTPSLKLAHRIFIASNRRIPMSYWVPETDKKPPQE